MKTTKLTKSKLDKLIKEEIDKLYEQWGLGLASTKPALKPIPKVYKKERLSSSTMKVGSIEDIPKAYDPSISPDTKVLIELDPLELTDKAKYQQELEKKIKSFQALYRSMGHDIRYGFEKWLRKALLKRLTYEEAQELVSSSIASSKGYTGAVDKNRKPR